MEREDEQLSHSDPLELEDRILELCTANEKGITEQTIITDQPSINVETRKKALQRLLSVGKIEVYKQGSSLIYRLKTNVGTSSTKGFELEEKVVYQIIEGSGTKGIWTRDIRTSSNLTDLQINKCLKTLESKKLVKKVKTVPPSKKKIYMLFHLEPDESLTGGAWYSDQEFETEFVDVLNVKCQQYLQKKARNACSEHSAPLLQRRASSATVSEVCEYIKKLNISRVDLTHRNLESILNTLVFDGKAVMMHELGPDGTSIKVYRATKLYTNGGQHLVPGFSRTPCGICPVIDQCTPDGAISPLNCTYMKDWLRF